VTIHAGPIPFGANVAGATVAMPHVTTTSAPLGTAIDINLAGQSGLMGSIVGGTQSTPLTSPILGDAWWVDPIAGVPLMAGITPLLASVSVPANPVFLGTRLVFQGLTW